MNIEKLKLILSVRGLSQSQLARMAGLSRQAVSLWFKSKSQMANVKSSHLQKLALNLNLPTDELLKAPPLADPEKAKVQVALLWDALFPSLEAFAMRVATKDPRALARLAQVFGLFTGAAIAGKWIWVHFNDYKKYMAPVRRKECERIWQLQRNLGLI